MLKISELVSSLSQDLGFDEDFVSYVKKRSINEGAFFVMTLLPKLSKHILKCLEKGFWENFGTEFRCHKGLPIFMKGYLCKLFAYHDGLKKWVSLDTNCCPITLYQIRQLSEYLYKLSVDFSEKEIQSAWEKFLDTEDDLRNQQFDEVFVNKMRNNMINHYVSFCKLTVDDCVRNARHSTGTFANCDDLRRNGIDPYVYRHHIGAVFPKNLYNTAKKFYYPEKDNIIPFSIRISDHVSDTCSEVLFVPKDSRGPRTICREPLANQFVQLGFFDLSSKALERDSDCRINFVRQDVNRNLAYESSLSRSYSTLDLKDASDRVSYKVVSYLFSARKNLLTIVNSCRTPYFVLSRQQAKKANISDNSKRRFNKLAGMGSGLTFPILALLVKLSVDTYIASRCKIPFAKVMKQTYVYGDDLIVPTVWAHFVQPALSKVLLLQNVDKSYSDSHFRESCGADYFYGNDVRPVLFKGSNCDLVVNGDVIQVNPDINQKRYDMSHDKLMLVLTEHCKELIKKQLFATAEYIYKSIEKHINRPLPYVGETSTILGRFTTDHEKILSQFTFDETGACKPIYGLKTVYTKHAFVDRISPSHDFSSEIRDVFYFLRSSSYIGKVAKAGGQKEYRKQRREVVSRYGRTQVSLAPSNGLVQLENDFTKLVLSSSDYALRLRKVKFIQTL